MDKLTEKQKAEIEALVAMRDEEIDFSDIPEGPVNPAKGRRGLFYRPVKQEITLSLDEYVIDWFEENEPDEKARHAAINEALAEYIRNRKLPHRKSGKHTAGPE